MSSESPTSPSSRESIVTAADENRGADTARRRTRAHHVHGLGGWVEHAVALTGVTTGKVFETRCRFNGAPKCLFDVTW